MMTRHADLLPRYKHLRSLGLGLNNKLVEGLSRDVLDEGGRKLGVLKRNSLVLDTEDELSVLMDYCIHDVRRNGVNGVERYLATSPPPPDSDELVLLRALRRSRFSVFTVEECEPGAGIGVRDHLTDERPFLVDVGLSRTAPVGMVVAARVMAPEGIGMTTGAALPVGVLSAAESGRFLGRLKANFRGTDFAHMAPEEAGEWAAAVIRACLRRGAARRIRYVEPG